MRTLTFFFFVSLACLASAQTPIVITEADIADEGDQFILTNANPVVDFDADDTGADHEWDFSDLEVQGVDTSRWLDEEDTNPAYFFLWLSSDIAEQTSVDVSTEFFTMEDVFNFYRKNDDRLALSGLAGSIGGIPLPVSFEDDDVIFEFPLEYENTFSSSAAFEMYVPGLATWSETRHRETTVDGWGMLTTPYGEFEVLRTRSEAEIIDTIWYDVLEIPFTYISVEYKWMAKEGGIPMLQINTQNFLGTETVTQVMYRQGPVVADIPSSGTMAHHSKLYPSVTAGDMTLEVYSAETNKYLVEIYNMQGELQPLHFYTVAQGANLIHLPMSLPSGFYLLILKEENHIISTHPFIKSARE